MGEKQLRNALDKLIEKGVLQTGEFNSHAYDRTKWYSFVDEEKWLLKKTVSKGRETGAERAVAGCRKGITIPDSKPDSKPDKIIGDDILKCFDYYNSFADKHKLAKAQILSETRKKHIKARIKDAEGV